MMEDSFKIGDLVIDADPYKAPEQYKGHGIITDVIDSNYVVVHWPKYNMSTSTKTIFLQKISIK